eukprot:TRINITY_DN783_c0_g1_i11.p1 TRINITY_DN783_c0_g1~~TRINITY_DN783_c0_g1_i11.p1  ORF type:complete len:512 (-),score=95.68 TRINITY_DN783_c0_g1_i11:315-1850(-)
MAAWGFRRIARHAPCWVVAAARAPGARRRITCIGVTCSQRSASHAVSNDAFAESQRRERALWSLQQHCAQGIQRKPKRRKSRPARQAAAAGPALHTIPVPSARLELQVACISTANTLPPGDLPNQDSVLIERDLNGDPNKHLFGVFDGHGRLGHHCSQFARNSFSGALRCSKSFEESVSTAYQHAFHQVNAQMHQTAALDDRVSGTCAATVCVCGDWIYVANLGDSRVLVAQEEAHKWGWMDLSADQTPFRPDELQRVTACGAEIRTMADLEADSESQQGPGDWTLSDPPRLFVPGTLDPGYPFTRALGDSFAEPVGLSATPEVARYQLCAKDKAVVVCSHGVFDFLESMEVAAIAEQHQDQALQAARAVVSEAHRRSLSCHDSTDDLTALVIQIVREGDNSKSKPQPARDDTRTPVFHPVVDSSKQYYKHDQYQRKRSRKPRLLVGGVTVLDTQRQGALRRATDTPTIKERDNAIWSQIRSAHDVVTVELPQTPVEKATVRLPPVGSPRA